MKIEEIKSYKCSDGKVFDTKAKAEEHEKELNNPEYKTEKRITELEKKILKLEAENAALSARVAALESKNSYPWRKPNPDIYPQPWPPYQQPFNPAAPTPKLPSEPGNVMYCSEDLADLSKLSDEELIKKGYNVTYMGHKRAVCPPITQFDFDNVKANNATTSPEYKGNPLDNQDCGINYGGNSGVYGDLDKK